MNRNTSQTAKVLGVDGTLVKKWAWLFRDYLGPGANPEKGKARSFNDSDVLVLCYVCSQWDDDSDIEAIKAGLNIDEHYDDRLREQLYWHTPLLQEPPDDLDETWRHGLLLCGAGRYEYLELARSYRRVAESALQAAFDADDLDGAAYPVLFAYRHTLELYLKIIGQVSETTHSLKDCVLAVEKRFGKKLGTPMRDWILELDRTDPRGTAFRYSNEPLGRNEFVEHWFDFVHFRFAMDHVFRVIDHAILSSGTTGRPDRSERVRKSA